MSVKVLKKLSVACVVTGLLSAGAVDRAQAVEPEDDHLHRIADNEWSSPELRAQPSLERLDLNALLRSDGDRPTARFFAAQGGDWDVVVDTRSGRPHLIEGSGFPILPGKGNSLSDNQLGFGKAELTPESVARRVDGWLKDQPDVLGLEGLDLRLDLERSLLVGDEGHLWIIELQQFHDGLRVEDARAFFRINHGNIIQMGTDKVAEVKVSTMPVYTDAMALDAALAEIARTRDEIKLSRDSELLIVPVLGLGEQPGFAYSGTPGDGYAHRLAWRLHYVAERGGIEREFRVTVDAHSGEVLENVDLVLFATVSGKIFPVTNTDPLVNVNMPYTKVTNNGTKYTNSSGSYSYSGGTATARLDGRYIRIVDNCGSIAKSNSSTGNLSFGGVSGTDCTTPGSGGAGNTNSARSAFYHLTNINRKAATFFSPGSAARNWIDGTLNAEVNINNTCNAFWSPSVGDINFYRSGGGCSNTGEIAAIFLHEWGHGMDQMAGGTSPDRGSGEAVGDTFAFLETQDACIGENFRPGVACANCRSSCTGVRDLDAFAWGGISTLARPDTIADNGGINCDRYSCPYGNYKGPMGYQGHCESHIASTANWDLTQILVDKYGSAGWSKMDDIWYGSLTSAGSAYRVASGGQCNPNATVDGCLSNNWYKLYLAVDDNDGNLTNGTPNACRIWDAFNTHGIACGDRPICSGDAPSCIQQPTGIKAWWPMDEHIGTEAAEVLVSQEGTYHGGAYAVNGKVSKAHYFDGSNDYASVPDSSHLDVGSGDFSLAAWIKTTDSHGTIVSKRAYTGGKYVGYLFMVYNGRLLLQIGNTTSSWANYTSTSIPQINDGNWHHVAVTVDRNYSSGGRFYVDGSLVYTFNPTGRQGNISNSSILTIGRTSNSSSDFLKGSIDEVQLFNRSISSSVVSSLKNAGSQGVCHTKPLSASVSCSSIGFEFFCSAYASGGSGGYNYSWSASGSASVIYSSGSWAEIWWPNCSPNSFATVSATVTDSSGSSRFAYDNIFCAGDGGPIPF